MATKAFMNNESQKRMTDSMRRAGMQYREMGYANGYVAVSPDHPLHGIDCDRVYDMTDISVWGGLTFSETAEHCRAWNSDCIEIGVLNDGGSPCAIRGGSWCDEGGDCSLVSRIIASPSYRDKSHGFRIVLVPVK